MRRRWVLRGLRVALVVAVAVAVSGTVVMQLWNWLTPSLFGWPTIGFGQALGLLLLTRLLFGGFRGRAGYGGQWRRRLRDRWEQMTPEERESFRQSVRGRCGPVGTPAGERSI